MRDAPEIPLAHGGNLDDARRRYPDAPEPWIDLSTGINPVPYPVPRLDTETWARLPLASGLDALSATAAARYGAADPGMVVAAAGAQALIQILPQLFPQSRVAVLSPTYGEHRAAWARDGHEVIEAHDPEEAQADILVVVNPNNPSGFIIPPDALGRMARVRFLIVDEAFVDVLEPGASLVPSLPPRTIVLRSLGKAYGLAGLRLGFAVAERETAAVLRARLGPWPVSGPALIIGQRALADDRWLADTRVRLSRDAERLGSLLSGAGFALIGGTPLFQLAAHPAAETFATALGRQGIHVRAFADHPTWLRFGLPGDEPAWLRLQTSLAAVAPSPER